MKGFVGKKMVIILFSLMLVSLFSQVGLALDNLSLTGFVRSIDKNNGIISVQITSGSCKGLRTFRVPDNAKDDLDDWMGKPLRFVIDSSQCEQGKLYNIMEEKP